MCIFLDVESNIDKFLHNNSLKQFRYSKYSEKHKKPCFLHQLLVANAKK